MPTLNTKAITKWARSGLKDHFMAYRPDASGSVWLTDRRALVLTALDPKLWEVASALGALGTETHWSYKGVRQQIVEAGVIRGLVEQMDKALVVTTLEPTRFLYDHETGRVCRVFAGGDGRTVCIDRLYTDLFAADWHGLVQFRYTYEGGIDAVVVRQGETIIGVMMPFTVKITIADLPAVEAA